MTRGKPLPIILKFTLPLIIGNLFQQLYNMADTIIVGRYVGPDALAAVGATGTIMFLVLGFSQGLTTGFTVLTGQAYGAGDRKRVRHSVSNGIILSFIVSAAVTVISVVFMPTLLRMMNTPADIFDESYTYIVIICYGATASIFYNLFSAYLRAVGNSKIPLVFLIFSAALNVVLDLVFIITFRFGVAGAALATVISQGVSAILCLIYIYQKSEILHPKKEDWRLTRADTAHQLTVGIPMALQFAVTAAGTMIMQAAINLFGSVAVAAYTAAGKLQGLLMQGMLSVGQAIAAYVGQNFGKGDLDRVETGVRQSAVASVVYSLIATVIAIALVGPSLHLFFTGEADMNLLREYALTYIKISSVFYIPLSLIFVYRNAMQACGYALMPTLGGVVELVARLIMAAISMVLVSYTAACFCDPFAWLTTGIFDFVAYRLMMKKIRKKWQGNAPIAN